MMESQASEKDGMVFLVVIIKELKFLCVDTCPSTISYVSFHCAFLAASGLSEKSEPGQCVGLSSQDIEKLGCDSPAALSGHFLLCALQDSSRTEVEPGIFSKILT